MATNKRSIPEIRTRLKELAEDHNIDELRDLAEELNRNAPVTLAKPGSAQLTPKLADEIRQYSAANPTLYKRHIGEKFNVNPGHVSEALNNLL